MVRKFPQLRENVADAITYHPGNRTGTPEQRHVVSLMLADAVLRVVRPCTCDGDPIECSHEAARGQAEAEVERLRAGEDPTPADEGTERTPGQFLHSLHQLTGDERIAKLAALRDAVGAGERCFLHGHDGLRHELDAANRNIRRLLDGSLAADLNGRVGSVRHLAEQWVAQAPPEDQTGTPSPEAFAAELAAVLGRAVLAVVDQPTVIRHALCRGGNALGAACPKRTGAGTAGFTMERASQWDHDQRQPVRAEADTKDAG